MPLIQRARPEHLEVRLVPDLERPVLDDLLEAVPVHEVLHEVANEILPTLPVFRRRHDRGVVEDLLARVGRQVERHEGDLDHRVEPQTPDVVVDAVDAGEVVHRLAVDFPVDSEVVAEDAVRPHTGDPELLVRCTERGGELGPDHPPAGAVARERVRQVLAADHRAPRTVQQTEVTGGVDAHRHGSRRVRRSRRHPRRGMALHGDVGQSRHGVPPLGCRPAGGVDIRRMRHR